MAEASSSFASSAISFSSSLPASAAAGVVTAANNNNINPQVGFRSSAGVMASLPRLLIRMATFGYIDTDSTLTNSSLPSVEAITTNVSYITEAVAEAIDGFVQNAGDSGEGVDEAVGAAGAAAESAASSGPSATDSLRGIGNVFTYVTSRWAVLCLFMTVLLNRTLIYASLRRPIQLPFKIRFAMRIVPILMFLHQIFNLMFAIRCQSSAEYMGRRQSSDPETTAFFYRAIGKVGSWWLDDRQVCEAVGMIPDLHWTDLVSTIQDPENPEIEIERPKGSLELLWPLYKTLSLSQFVEVFTCALNGRVPASETGMTLLEHSLAFAEAEALAVRKTYLIKSSVTDGEDSELKIFKVKGHKVVPVEVLYIALISSMSHVTSHIMAIFNCQSEFRLISTGFFGIAFLGGFALALVKGGAMGILHFPTVSVVGFIPHLLIFAGIAICAFIYTLALMLSSMFPPSGRRGFREGFNNLRANLTLSTVSVSMSEDFYTTLLKLGFMCLTAASEATYLNEGRAVRVPGWTWLEGERSKLLDSQRSVLGKSKAGEYLPSGIGAGPYAKERKDFRGIVNDGTNKGKRRTGGAGKWIGAGEMIRGVGVVLGRWGLQSAGRIFSRAASPTDSNEQNVPHIFNDPMSQLLREELESGTQNPNINLTDFLTGEPLPDIDESADFVPSIAASVISESDYYSSDSDSQDTPTGTPRRRRSASMTPSPPEDGAYLTDLFDSPQHLASLLDPTTPEERASARLLARHLKSPHVLTRHTYETTMLPLCGATEEDILESILFTRRKPRRRDRDEDDDRAEGNGPVCVVCHCAQRTIIVWPCRCLSLCEDCRVCLAMNNFSNCVTCRQPSEGFSRIYIP